MEKTEEEKPKEQVKDGEEEKKTNSKQEREKKKQERLAARQKKGQEEEEYKIDPNDPCIEKFGDAPLNRSQSNPEDRYKIKYTAVKDLNAELKGQEVYLVGRLQSSRVKGKAGFLVLRDQFSTVQTTLFVGDHVSKGMIEWAKRIPKESIISLMGVVEVPEQEVSGCSQKVEVSIRELRCINRSATILPFQIEDASRKVENQAEEDDGGA